MIYQVQRLPENLLGRDFAVGDIHGAFAALQRALDAIGFDGATDRLISMGDLVDTGPQSDRVLDWLDQPWFYAVCGNHDFMTWRSALGRPFEPVDHLQCGGGWLQGLVPAEQQRIGTRLAALPIAIEVTTAGGAVGLIHADFPSDDWHDLVYIDWTALDQMDSPAGQCLWSIERYRQRYQGLVKHIRAVVHGHMTVPVMEKLGNVYYIDTGGWHPSGHFTFLELRHLVPVMGPGTVLVASNRKRNR